MYGTKDICLFVVKKRRHCMHKTSLHSMLNEAGVQYLCSNPITYHWALVMEGNESYGI